MLQKIRRLFDAFNTAVGFLSGLIIFFIGCILFAEVVCRWAGYPTEWIPEWSIYLFFWAMLGGASYTLMKGKHVRVELLLMHLGPKAGNLLDMFISLVGAAFCALVAAHGWAHLTDVIQTGETTPTTLRLPLWLTDFPLFFGFAALAVQFVILAADRGVALWLIQRFGSSGKDGETGRSSDARRNGRDSDERDAPGQGGAA